MAGSKKKKTAKLSTAALKSWVHRLEWSELEAALLLSSRDPGKFKPVKGFYEYAVESDDDGYGGKFKFVKPGETYPEDVLAWLQVMAIADRRGQLPKEQFPSGPHQKLLSPKVWVDWAGTLGDSYQVPAQLKLAIAEQIKIKRPPGPKPGTVARFAAADRTLFPELQILMREKNLSHFEAALELAKTGQVKGRGSMENAARRLADLFRKECRIE